MAAMDNLSYLSLKPLVTRTQPAPPSLRLDPMPEQVLKVHRHILPPSRKTQTFKGNNGLQRQMEMSEGDFTRFLVSTAWLDWL